MASLFQFENNFDINNPVSTRFCLGGDVYISISFFKNEYRVHVRRFNTVPDSTNPEIFYTYPTKTGLVLSPEQIMQMYQVTPTILRLLGSQREAHRAFGPPGPSSSSSPAPAPLSAASLEDVG